jgi:hypothetical protein
LLFGCCLLVVVLLPGCSTGPRTYKVSGTVTFDGKPLPDGDILFISLDKATGPVAAKIRDGRFELKAREGKKRVEVSAARILPGSKVRGAGGEPVAEEYLPESYNNKSTLTAAVAARDDNNFEFKLDSKGQ